VRCLHRKRPIQQLNFPKKAIFKGKNKVCSSKNDKRSKRKYYLMMKDNSFSQNIPKRYARKNVA